MEQNNSADLLLVIDMQNVYTKGQEWACEGVETASASIPPSVKQPDAGAGHLHPVSGRRTPGRCLEGI